MKKIAIGILAYNEEKNIPTIVKNLDLQTVFNADGYENCSRAWIIANGCTDNTEKTAEKTISNLAEVNKNKFTVIKIKESSKTNAWNYFIHECVTDDFEYICMIDADIVIDQQNLIENCVLNLQKNSEAKISVDCSIKYFSESNKYSIMKYINILFQRSKDSNVALSGQFYCAKTRFLKKITLPVGLLTQDGFLRAMTLTDGLTRSEDFKRIIQTPHAYHLHPAYTDFRQLVRYNKRQAIGTAIQTLVYKELEKMPSDFGMRMSEIQRRNIANPNWVKELISQHASTSHKFVHNSYAFRMLRSVQKAKGKDRLKWILLPVGIIFDLCISILANRELANSDLGSISANHGKFKIRS